MRAYPPQYGDKPKGHAHVTKIPFWRSQVSEKLVSDLTKTLNSCVGQEKLNLTTTPLPNISSFYPRHTSVSNARRLVAPHNLVRQWGSLSVALSATVSYPQMKHFCMAMTLNIQIHPQNKHSPQLSMRVKIPFLLITPPLIRAQTILRL